MRSKAALWALLAVPAALIVFDYLTRNAYAGDYLHPTGEWSARFVILALMLTPLSMLLPRQNWVQWLLSRRRAFGVAGFGYALLHLIFYLIDMETVRNILAEMWALGIWTGWAAFLLLLPLALTSNQWSMRRLKSGWRRLQRLAYGAALLTLAHWLFVHDGFLPALLSFAPLAALEIWRVARRLRTGSSSRQPSAPI
jgi:sulfoxide reductase heme-binding subunit YedZ